MLFNNLLENIMLLAQAHFASCSRNTGILPTTFNVV